MPPKRSSRGRVSAGEPLSLNYYPSSPVRATRAQTTRPKRVSLSAVDYNPARRQAPNSTPSAFAKGGIAATPRSAKKTSVSTPAAAVTAPRTLSKVASKTTGTATAAPAKPDVEDPPKRRGRPPKAATTATQSSSAKIKQIANKAAAATTTATMTAAAENAATAAPRARGRPRSSASAPAPSGMTAKRKRDDAVAVEAPVAKKRGRPPGVPTSTKSAAPSKAQPKPASKPSPSAVQEKRGRPALKPTSVGQVTAGMRKPRKVAASADADVSATKQSRARSVNKAISRAGTGKSRTAEMSKPATKATPKKRRIESDPDMDLTDAENTPEIQYWLMKAEPDARVEKGVDVAFPIEKLAAATEPEPWDGVRNPVARNHMRSMRLNDLAFFYHSNCKDPGIVGVMRIVAEHSIDHSAFDPTHPYYDPKSDRSKPKWDCVKVEFVKKFDAPILLKTLKSTPELSEMQIAQKAYGRLSVQTVKPREWAIVLEMAGEDKDLGQPAKASGYEAGTDGETEGDEDKQNVADEQVDGTDEIDADKMAAYGSPEPGLESTSALRMNGAMETDVDMPTSASVRAPPFEDTDRVVDGGAIVDVVESTQPIVDGAPFATTATVITQSEIETTKETTIMTVFGSAGGAGIVEFDAMESDGEGDEIED